MSTYNIELESLQTMQTCMHVERMCHPKMACWTLGLLHCIVITLRDLSFRLPTLFFKGLFIRETKIASQKK